MKQIMFATIMIALVLTLSIINANGLAFAHRYHNSDFQDDSTSSSSSSSSDTGGNQLLCWAAGGMLLLGGVPAPAVLAAGAEAHNIGICP
jgi:hypothetical protein